MSRDYKQDDRYWYYVADKALHDLFYKGLVAGEDETMQSLFAKDPGSKHRYAKHHIDEAKARVAKAIIKHRTEQIPASTNDGHDERIEDILARLIIDPAQESTPAEREQAERDSITMKQATNRLCELMVEARKDLNTDLEEQLQELKKPTDDKQIKSWEEGHQNAGFNKGIDAAINIIKDYLTPPAGDNNG